MCQEVWRSHAIAAGLINKHKNILASCLHVNTDLVQLTPPMFSNRALLYWISPSARRQKNKSQQNASLPCKPHEHLTACGPHPAISHLHSAYRSMKKLLKKTKHSALKSKSLLLLCFYFEGQ